jgi:hypothetical protein
MATGQPVATIGVTKTRELRVASRGVEYEEQAFDESGLQPVGKFQSAQAKFIDVAEIDPQVTRRWLK